MSTLRAGRPGGRATGPVRSRTRTGCGSGRPRSGWRWDHRSRGSGTGRYAFFFHEYAGALRESFGPFWARPQPLPPPCWPSRAGRARQLRRPVGGIWLGVLRSLPPATTLRGAAERGGGRPDRLARLRRRPVHLSRQRALLPGLLLTGRPPRWPRAVAPVRRLGGPHRGRPRPGLPRPAGRAALDARSRRVRGRVSTDGSGQPTAAGPLDGPRAGADGAIRGGSCCWRPGADSRHRLAAADRPALGRSPAGGRVRLTAASGRRSRSRWPAGRGPRAGRGGDPVTGFVPSRISPSRDDRRLGVMMGEIRWPTHERAWARPASSDGSLRSA